MINERTRERERERERDNSNWKTLIVALVPFGPISQPVLAMLPTQISTTMLRTYRHEKAIH